jgi:hypothetical protein
MVAQVKPVTSALTTIDDPDFPHNLSVRDAKLPVVYESAKLALSECSRIDECKDWADKAEALASYARQADDDTLMNTAIRIRARAIRRCGELLKEIEPAKNQHDVSERARDGSDPSRKQVARDAGLSERQHKTAIRVANVPAQQFESAVESSNPPTVTKLAEIGTKSQPKTQHQKTNAVVEIFPQAPTASPKAGPQPLIDLKGRSEADFQACTKALGATERFDEFAVSHTPAAVIRGSSEIARRKLKERIPRLIKWLQQLQKELA